LKEDNSHLNVIQLRYKKILLDILTITKYYSTKFTKSTIDSVSLNELTLSKELISSKELTLSKLTLSKELIFSKELSILSTLSISIISAILLTQFILAIIEDYKTNIQFSKILIASIESSIYLLDAEELLYLAILDRYRLYILDIKVRKRRATNLRELLISHVYDIIAYRAYRLIN
jgi:hypothetical protein